MYHERYGFKSGVNGTIRADLKSVVEDALGWFPDPRGWLDIASNDGTLLSNVPERVHRTGIDPVAKYCVEAEQYADRIVNDFFDQKHFRPGEFDVVTSVSMFYDLDDPNEFVNGVQRVLAEDGVWVIQQNYLLATLELGAVDNVCHEHLTYFSLLALEHLLDRHGLEVVDVSTSPVNGGSFRTVVARRGAYAVRSSVAAQRDRELDAAVDTIHPYRVFERRVRRNLADLKALIDGLNAQGKRVYIYGASTRGGTIWQAAGLTVDDLPKAVERNPEKVGKRIASIGVPIISEEQAREEHPEYMLVSPWFFRDEFVEREADYLASGGRFIWPLPRLEVS
jgi:SAM-dependent methyltransferase